MCAQGCAQGFEHDRQALYQSSAIPSPPRTLLSTFVCHCPAVLSTCPSWPRGCVIFCHLTVVLRGASLWTRLIKFYSATPFYLKLLCSSSLCNEAEKTPLSTSANYLFDQYLSGHLHSCYFLRLPCAGFLECGPSFLVYSLPTLRGKCHRKMHRTE